MRYLLLALLLTFSPVSAQELKIIVPSSSDGYAINGKLVARHISKYLPEKPTVIVQEMPGARGIIAANWLYNIAPKDGNTIGTFYKDVILIAALEKENVKYDATKFVWLGSTYDGREDSFVLWSNKTDPIAKYKQEKLIVGSEFGVLGDPNVLIKNTLGLNMKIVSGYKTPSELRLAVDRNEINAVNFSLLGTKITKPNWLQPNSEVKPLIQYGNGKKRHRELMNVPTLSEMIDKIYDPYLDVYEKQFILLRPFVAPPGIPPKRAEELKIALQKVLSDSEFLQEASKLKIETKYVSSQESYNIVNDIINAPEETLTFIRNLK